jgi:hypothetical protein
MNRLADMCISKDYILKVTYSTHIGWTVKVYKRGHSNCVVRVVNDDMCAAFDTACEEVKLLEYNEQ